MANDNPAQPPLHSMTFEQAIAELETIVSQLEQGKIELDNAVTMYDRGKQLKEYCEKKLQEAKLKLEQVETKDISEPT